MYTATTTDDPIQPDSSLHVRERVKFTKAEAKRLGWIVRSERMRLGMTHIALQRVLGRCIARRLECDMGTAPQMMTMRAVARLIDIDVGILIEIVRAPDSRLRPPQRKDIELTAAHNIDLNPMQASILARYIKAYVAEQNTSMAAIARNAEVSALTIQMLSRSERRSMTGHTAVQLAKLRDLPMEVFLRYLCVDVERVMVSEAKQYRRQ